MSPVRAVDPADGGTARLQSTRWNVIVAVRRNASGISELRCTLAARGSGAGERSPSPSKEVGGPRWCGSGPVPRFSQEGSSRPYPYPDPYPYPRNFFDSSGFEYRS